MSKKRNKIKNNLPNKSEQSISRRKLIAWPLVIVAVGASIFGIKAIEANNSELRDLSVIGKGSPVIVQIYDPACSVCRRLSKVLKISTKDQDTVKQRLADITTTEGKALQTKYNVPHITLLYFNEKGRHIHTTSGMQTKDNITAEIKRLF